jgi:hypothetical protein
VKKARSNLKKRIAAAGTWGEKMSLAQGDDPGNLIRRFVEDVASLRVILRDPSPPKEFEKLRAKWRDNSQARFGKLFFPKVLNDNPEAFERLIEEMAAQRRGRQTKDDPLRKSLLALFPDPPVAFVVTRIVKGKLRGYKKKISTPKTWREVMDRLEGLGVPDDASTVKRAARALGIKLGK